MGFHREKLHVFRDPSRGFGYSVFLTKEIDGKRYIAKPLVEIEWLEWQESHCALPSFVVGSIELEETKPLIQGKFDQIKEDKEDHLNNLNEIIKALIGKI